MAKFSVTIPTQTFVVEANDVQDAIMFALAELTYQYEREQLGANAKIEVERVESATSQ